jgi:hypothetical protein
MPKIILKKSSVTSKVPTANDLVHGELAINYADGKLFYKNASNSVQEFSANVANALTIGTGLSGTSYNGSLPVTIALASNYGDTTNPYASKTAGYVLAAPSNTNGQPTFRALEASDIPTLNQNTTGTASNVTGTIAIANGGTGQTTKTNAFDALSPLTTKGDIVVHDGTNNIRVPIGTTNYVLTADSAQASGLKWAPQTGGNATITVKEINSGGTVETVNGVTTLNFDADGGFDVVDQGSGQVKITMNSTFKYWQVAGQTTIVASGLDTIKFVPSNGISITTNTTANPKEIGFSLNAGLDNLSDVVITSPTNGQVLKYNGTSWINGTSSGGIALTDISVTDTGGDGSLSYNNTTGVITYTGPSASDVRAHFSAGTGISITSGEIANTGVTSISGTANQITASASTGSITLSLPSSLTVPGSLAVTTNITSGTWQASTIGSQYGGTGINNGSRTITVLTDSVEFTSASGGSSVTLPNTGTLSTLSGTETLTNKTIAGATISGHLIPSTNVTYDLGSATYRFRDLYLSGSTIQLGTATLTTSGDSVSITAIDNTPIGATTKSTGAFTTLTANGAITFTNTTASTSTTTGAVVISGGVGLDGRLNTSKSITIVNGSGYGEGLIFNNPNNEYLNQTGQIFVEDTGNAPFFESRLNIYSGGEIWLIPANSNGVPFKFLRDAENTVVATQVALFPRLKISDISNENMGGVSASTSISTGALVVEGGVGIAGNLNVGENIVVTGNLTVNGTTTTINSTTISVDDKNIELGSTASPTDTTANGGGITLKGATDKTFNWSNTTSAWTSSEHVALAAGKTLLLNGSTSGTITVQATATAGTNTITLPSTTGIVITTGDTGSVTNTMLAGSISDTKLSTISTAGKVSNSATTATNTNTASAIVLRDSSGNFSAGTITATLSGNASTVTNGVYTTDIGTVTNTMLAGSISNDKLSNSSITINGTSVSLGGTRTINLSELGTVNITSPTNGQVLGYNGTSWVNTTSSGGTPGGSNTQVQYNSSGSFAGSSNLTFDGTNLTVGGDVAVNGGDITSTASTVSLFNTTAFTGNILGAAKVVNIGASTGITKINNTLELTATADEGLTGVTITSTSGVFSCNTAGTIKVGDIVNIAGIITGTGTISGYDGSLEGGTSYYIISTNGSTTFTLGISGTPLTTTAGTTTGAVFTLTRPGFRLNAGIITTDKDTVRLFPYTINQLDLATTASSIYVGGPHTILNIGNSTGTTPITTGPTLNFSTHYTIAAANKTTTVQSDVTTGTVYLFDGITTGTINIGTTGASTANISGAGGTVNIGKTTGNSTLNIRGNGISGTATINSNVTTGSANLFQSLTTGTLNIGSAAAGKVAIAFNTASSSTTTGALTLAGGLGVLGSAYVGGTLYAGSNNTDVLSTVMIIAVSDETTALTTGTAKITFRAPFAMTLTQIPRASVATASTSGLVTVDINESGTSVLGANKLSIDANEKTSTTAATATTLADTSIADDAEITIDIDAAGTGAKGLKIHLYYKR